MIPGNDPGRVVPPALCSCREARFQAEHATTRRSESLLELEGTPEGLFDDVGLRPGLGHWQPCWGRTPSSPRSAMRVSLPLDQLLSPRPRRRFGRGCGLKLSETPSKHPEEASYRQAALLWREPFFPVKRLFSWQSRFYHLSSAWGMFEGHCVRTRTRDQLRSSTLVQSLRARLRPLWRAR